MLPVLLACSGSPSDSGDPLAERTFDVTVINPAVAFDFPISGEVPPLGEFAHLDVRLPAPIGHSLTGWVGWQGTLVRFEHPLFDGRERVEGEGTVTYWQLTEGELYEVEFFEDPNVLDVLVYENHLTVVANEAIDGGAWFVHHGEPDVSGLAELQAGDPSVLVAEVSATTGLTAVFGPGVVVVHEPGQQPIFTAGEPDRGDGLESLAEDGNPLVLGNALQEEWPYVTVYGPGDVASGYSPIEPGGTTDFSVDVVGEQVVQVAFMFSQSNDLFLSGTFTPEDGADVTDAFELWDAGTEANEQPGFGSDQGPRQTDVNTGDFDEETAVRLVDDGWEYPEVTDYLRVTVAER